MKNPLKQIVEVPFFDLEGKICIELGVQKGNWSHELLKCNPKELWLIDCWQQQDPEIYKNDRSNVIDDEQERIYQSVITRFAKNSNVKIVRKFLDDAANDFPDSYFDFIYLDANHNYEPVLNDLNKWWPKLKISGWFTGHDLSWDRKSQPRFPVKTALEKFCKDNSLEYKVLTRGSWGIQK